MSEEIEVEGNTQLARVLRDAEHSEMGGFQQLDKDRQDVIQRIMRDDGSRAARRELVTVASLLSWSSILRARMTRSDPNALNEFDNICYKAQDEIEVMRQQKPVGQRLAEQLFAICPEGDPFPHEDSDSDDEYDPFEGENNENEPD